MGSEENDKLILLPHHEQMPLCTSRKPYRQGRNLTAVKVYSITNESNHLLIFGVPSLNLRQETKAQFMKFGKLSQFSLSKNHLAEEFTETYHAVYERIQSARLAKKMLDTKNFYGGSLHVCYAPEYESVYETRQKLLRRQQDVLHRLKNLQKESADKKVSVTAEEITEVVDNRIETDIKLNMGKVNTISYENSKASRKRINENRVTVIDKKFKPCFISDENVVTKNTFKNIVIDVSNGKDVSSDIINKDSDTINSKVEVIDFTSTEVETISNINDSLNYNNFGNEIIRKVAAKPMNRIKFYVDNKKLN